MSERRFLASGFLALAAFVVLLGAIPAMAGVLFKDDFEDGIVDTSVYIAVGNAVITESGGKMHIQTFGPDDGVEILVPKHTACLQIQTEIPEVEFDQFESFGVSATITDQDGDEHLLVAAELLRPFWNRCQVTWKFGDGPSQTEGIWG
jgi:hypothetical protein